MQNETAKIFQEAEKPIYKSLNEIIEEQLKNSLKLSEHASEVFY